MVIFLLMCAVLVSSIYVASIQHLANERVFNLTILMARSMLISKLLPWGAAVTAVGLNMLMP
jgi:ABC-type thiamin/hydroxymethylpyrimidine transport system permease subunit